MDDFSQEDWEKMKMIMKDPHIDPNLKKTIKWYEHMMLLPQRSQEESDRRWNILVEAEEKLSEEEKPKTMGGHRDLLAKYGFEVAQVPKRAENDKGDFNNFMERFASGGLDMLDDYEMKEAPDAKPRCDECDKEAGLRCKQCGEYYCSRECQKKGWPEHKATCKMIAEQRTYKHRLDI